MMMQQAVYSPNVLNTLIYIYNMKGTTTQRDTGQMKKHTIIPFMPQQQIQQ